MKIKKGYVMWIVVVLLIGFVLFSVKDFVNNKGISESEISECKEILSMLHSSNESSSITIKRGQPRHLMGGVPTSPQSPSDLWPMSNYPINHRSPFWYNLKTQ